MKSEKEIKMQLEKVNAKIQYQLEMLAQLMPDMNDKKADPEKFIGQHYSWKIGQFEADLNTLLTVKQTLESIING